MSNDCLGTEEALRCVLDFSCAIGPRSCVCYHQFPLQFVRMDVASRSTGSQLTRHRLVTVTYELLFTLGPREMKHWAKVSKITWGIYDEYECKEAALNEIRYWEKVEEGWFSD